LTIATRAYAWRGWSVGLVVDVPVLSSTVTATEGSARAWGTLMGAEIGHAFGPESWRFHPDVAVGGGAVLLHLDGSAGKGFESGTANVWTAAATARAGVAMTIAGPLRVRVDARLGVAIPEGTVSFAGAKAATWGLPMVGGGAGLEVVWR